MENCPANNLMKILGKKWTLLILSDIGNKSRRFGELNKDIKISSRTLSKRLKEMEKIGVIKKQAFKEIPPKVEYSLTSGGKELIKKFKNIDKWIGKYKIKV